MLSGYDVPTHGVVLNNIWQTPEAKAEVVTIFQRAKEAGMVTVLIAGKKHFYYFERAGFLDYHLVDPAVTDLKLASFAADYIKSNDFDLMLVHFAGVDEAGHNYTWMSPEYLAAVEMADNAVRMVIRTLEARDILKNTLVIITADHGGTGVSHGDATLPTNKTIPWMVFGPCIKTGYAITGEVRIFDTAAIALWGLGIEIPTDFDGRIIPEVFELSEVGITATVTP
jgi:phosphopentomutase